MKHFLVINDATLIRRSVAFNLNQAGSSTATTGSAEETLMGMETHISDVILLDIGLPDMNSLQTNMVFGDLW
jgi:CheY-like chemotaxis protein